MSYKLDLLTVEDFNIIKKDIKTVYNTDDRVSLSDWIRNDKYKLVKQSLPTTNGLNLPTTNAEFKQPESFLGYLHDHSNNVQYNIKGVGLYSTTFSGTHGVFVTEKNFSNSVIGFTVRRVIQSNWVNQKDEYLKPNDNDVRYNQFYYDALVYQLFNNSSFQTSLRQVEYKDRLWDIKNEFFWMSVNEMKELADENEYDNLYNDARTASNRHVYNLLFGEERIYDRLSPDAKLVLDKATEMVKESMKMRKFMSDDVNHLDSWDAGYAQLKLVWKKYMEKDFKEFRQLYKNLEDRMRPLVYELGFLMK